MQVFDRAELDHRGAELMRRRADLVQRHKALLDVADGATMAQRAIIAIKTVAIIREANELAAAIEKLNLQYAELLAANREAQALAGVRHEEH